MAETRERPILFSAPMVRALLAGTKTQTRRVVKPQPSPCDHKPWPGEYTPNWVGDADGWHCAQCGNGHRLDRSSPSGVSGFRCPYGQPGDRLWVRETWAYHLHAQCSLADDDGPWVYAADGAPALQYRLCQRWRPSIHMPRYASRITLEVTGVRVERLQDISEADAKAEGIESVGVAWKDYGRERSSLGCGWAKPTESYRSLWEQINGSGSWAANPWVWVVEFRRIEGQP